MTTKLITFKTNQTIIADVVGETGESVTIKQPVQVIIQPSKEGPMIAFSPFLEFAAEFKTGITISRADILCVTSPITELENQYSRLFGTGIEIASAIPKM
jgi:hypothetical protein